MKMPNHTFESLRISYQSDEQMARAMFTFATDQARIMASRAVPAGPAPDDRQIADTVNALRDIATKFHASGQLRERIAHVIVPMLRAGRPTPSSDIEALIMLPGWIESASVRLYECNACDWRGAASATLMLGAIGPLCPECRETTFIGVDGAEAPRCNEGA